jgi:cytochrome c oxidase subunit 3
VKEVTHATAAAPHTAQAGLPPRKLAVWLFLGSEVLFFSALIGAFLYLRVSSPTWPTPDMVLHTLNIPLTALNTFLLVLSSVSVVLALDAIGHGNQRRVTLALGVTFLGIQVYEYSKLIGHGLTPTSVPAASMPGADPLFGSSFYAMTGFHGMHVLGGVLTLLLVLVKARRGLYTRDDHEGIELFGLYWHFVDIVWIGLFTIVYLI